MPWIARVQSSAVRSGSIARRRRLGALNSTLGLRHWRFCRAICANGVDGLSDDQLDQPYRPGGWTVRQVAHHSADGYLNSYTRFRWAITEPTPTIKPFEEEAWAELPDAKSGPIEPSLVLTDGASPALGNAAQRPTLYPSILIMTECRHRVNWRADMEVIVRLSWLGSEDSPVEQHYLADIARQLHRTPGEKRVADLGLWLTAIAPA
jgi:hypothetical protein